MLITVNGKISRRQRYSSIEGNTAEKFHNPYSMEMSSILWICLTLTCTLARYVGQTSRHLLNRIKEHKRKNSPVGIHFDLCKCSLSMDDVCVLGSSSRSITRLMTLEALWINNLKPSINTKDEYRSRTLVIKI